MDRNETDRGESEGLAALDPSTRQLVLDLDVPPSLGEEDFIVGAGNELAFAHIAAFPNWPHPLTLITGPAKAGKTHLGEIWRSRAGAVRATAANLADLAARGNDPVLLEDADRAGYDEVALFNLLNRAMRENRPILMTARADPEEWPLRTRDVLSRVRLAARFSVAPADDMQLSQMFVKLFSDRQIRVDPATISYTVARMERSPQEVFALVLLMDRLALARRSRISRAVAAEAIGLRAALHTLQQDR